MREMSVAEQRYLYCLETIQQELVAEARTRAGYATAPCPDDDPASEALVGAAFVQSAVRTSRRPPRCRGRLWSTAPRVPFFHDRTPSDGRPSRLSPRRRRSPSGG